MPLSSSTSILTTGGPPAPGYNGIGLIFSQFVANLEPTLTMHTVPTGRMTLALTPKLLMMGPQAVTNWLSPKLIMRGGNVGHVSVQFVLTPVLTIGNGTSATTAFTVTLTPTLTMTGALLPPAPPTVQPLDVAVNRAATI